MSKKEKNFKSGVGLDIGTMNIVSARVNEANNTVYKRVRDAFLDIPKENKKLLKMSRMAYTETEDPNKLFVLGDSALELAVMLNREVRRPLSRGVISSGELDAQAVLGLLTISVLGEPVEENEVCYFSVPATPVDDPTKNVTYHKSVFEKVLTSQGYKAIPTNEAMAVIYSQCGNEHFSGLAISFGAGMCNVALSYKTLEILSFSVARGGDWVDTQAANALGLKSDVLCATKEKDFDLNNPPTRDHQALSIYIQDLVRYCLETTVKQFSLQSKTIDTKIPLVISGGVCKNTSFLELFKTEFKKIQEKQKDALSFISEVRVAKDPLNAVAEGLLVLASISED